METLFLLRENCYSGIYFGGIFPQEIEDYIFKIVWTMKINECNTSYLKLFKKLKEINLPLTENCTIDESLDLYESAITLPILRQNLTLFQHKKLTSPYKWWNTRLKFNFTYRQVYFIVEQTQFFDNNWYYQEEYDIAATRFRLSFLEENEFEIMDYSNPRRQIQYIKKFKMTDVTDKEWSNRGVNNPEHSLFPDEFKNKKIVYHFELDEPLPLDYATICYYV